MNQAELDQVFSGFEGTVHPLDLEKDSDSLDSLPSWWRDVALGAGRDGARLTADVWSQLGEGQFERIRSLLRESGEVSAVRVEARSGFSGVALMYLIRDVDIRGEGKESAVWLGYPPRSVTVSSSDARLGNGVASDSMNRFYDLIHDGLDARPTGWAEIVASRDISDWGDVSGDTDDSIEFFNWHPYVPHVGNLMTLWQEAAGGIAVMLDVNTDSVWANASGELEYCPGPFVERDQEGDRTLALFDRIEERILVNFSARHTW